MLTQFWTFMKNEVNKALVAMIDDFIERYEVCGPIYMKESYILIIYNHVKL